MRPTRTLIALVALLTLVVVVVAIAVVLDRSDDRTTGVATGVPTTVDDGGAGQHAAERHRRVGGCRAVARGQLRPRPLRQRLDRHRSGLPEHACEVLIAESRVVVAFTSPTDCTVASGDWLDPWSGAQLTSARALDIDHTVPLANAWRSGVWAWTTEQRRAYANDLTDVDHLVAMALGENRSKGDGGPEGWKPPNPVSWCEYARDWTAIKARWNLTASPAEWSALLAMSATCS